MKVSVSPGHNINGTLIMPLFEGTESVPDGHAEGMHTALRSQMNTVLGDGDFKAKDSVHLASKGSVHAFCMSVSDRFCSFEKGHD